MIGSHNTFTYMRPRRWWMRLLTPFARCQSKPFDILDVNCLDLRIRYVNGYIYVSHGPVLYCTIGEAFTKISCLRKDVYVRVLLEGDFTTSALAWLDSIFSQADAKFFCGRDKNTWRKLLPSLPDIDVIQYVGSMQSRYGRVCPWLWSHINRKRLAELYKTAKPDKEKIYLFDFL